MLKSEESLCVGIEAESVCLLLTFVLEKKLDDDNQAKKAWKLSVFFFFFFLQRLSNAVT